MHPDVFGLHMLCICGSLCAPSYSKCTEHSHFMTKQHNQ